jgi:hypothetical protein
MIPPACTHGGPTAAVGGPTCGVTVPVAWCRWSRSRPRVPAHRPAAASRPPAAGRASRACLPWRQEEARRQAIAGHSQELGTSPQCRIVFPVKSRSTIHGDERVQGLPAIADYVRLHEGTIDSDERPMPIASGRSRQPYLHRCSDLKCRRLGRHPWATSARRVLRAAWLGGHTGSRTMTPTISWPIACHARAQEGYAGWAGPGSTASPPGRPVCRRRGG